MSTWKTIVSLFVVAFFGAAAGIAWAQEDPSPQPPPSDPAAEGDAATTSSLGGGLTESGFVPITPCRLVDTRLAGGPLLVGQIRSFAVRGSGGGFLIQGGKPGGCGIPSNATGIEVTLTAVNAGSGFLRAWPTGTSAPNATFMNYSSVFNVSNTGALAICNSGCVFEDDLNLRAFGSTTEVVADVSGYYIDRMAASVSAGGSLFQGNRVISTGKANNAPGQYEVRFDRDISQCTYVATVNADGGDGWASTALRVNTTDTVYVLTHNPVGAIGDRRFYLEVTC